MRPAMNKKLTEEIYWDDLWSGLQLPAEISRSENKLLLNIELDAFEKYLPRKELSMLEIGGAPGQYLAYFHRQFGYKIHCLDYSANGCEKTALNFKLLNIPGTVHQADIFLVNDGLPEFDIVFSMGFIEHFSNLDEVVGQHLKYLKPGGILMLGIPNLLGINKLFLKMLAPRMLARHNLNTMDIKCWKGFEDQFGLETIFKSYIGGFEPATFLVREKKTAINAVLFLKARVLNKIFHRHFSFLRNFNSRLLSGYALGIYRKPRA